MTTLSLNDFRRPETSSQEKAARVGTLNKTLHKRVQENKGSPTPKKMNPTTKSTFKEAHKEELFEFTRLNKEKSHKGVSPKKAKSTTKKVNPTTKNTKRFKRVDQEKLFEFTRRLELKGRKPNVTMHMAPAKF